MSGQIPATPSTVRRPKLQRLLGYWHARRGDRPMPARADIDPLDIPWILGNLSLFEVHRRPDGAPRYRCRLTGTRVVQRLRYDLTGRWLDELPEPGYQARVQECYAEMLQRREPQVERMDMIIDDRIHDYEILRLPLSADGEAIDMIMLAVDFIDPRV